MTAEASLPADMRRSPLGRTGAGPHVLLAARDVELVEFPFLAQANLRTGRLPEAKKYADRAQKSAPNDPSGSVVQGEVLRKQGDFRGAADAYGQALKVSRSLGLFEAQPSLAQFEAKADELPVRAVPA